MHHSVGTAVVLAGLLYGAGAATTAHAQPEAPVLTAPDATLPIELDADFSEFDRRNDRLVFRRLRIVQGPLSITADEASASPADFTDSVWTFTGNVVVEDATTEVSCEHAELAFLDNRLRLARLEGDPAQFQQVTTAGQPPTRGRANTLEYDLVAGTIRMEGNAWLADGQNEISGSSIAYDLRREVVTADAGGSGPVRMKITPPKDESPPAGQSGP